MTDPRALFDKEWIDSPALDVLLIVPSDSANFSTMIKAIYVGVGGDISLQTSQDNQVLFKNVPQGIILPVICWRVNSTNTSATNLLGLL